MKNPIAAVSRHARSIFIAGALASVITSASGQTVFTDNFNRADVDTGTTIGSTVIGNGWTFHSDSQSPERGGVRILDNRLQIGQNTAGGYAGPGGSDRSWLWQDTSNWASPYNSTLANNPQPVVWTFNLRTGQGNPTPVSTSGGATVAVFLATAETGSGDWQFGGGATGYFVTYNSATTTDPLKLMRMTDGVRNENNHTTIITAATTPFNDLSNQFLSVKVTYDPTSNEWKLFARNDGGPFGDPLSGTLEYLGAAIDSTYTATPLRYSGFFGNSNNGFNGGADENTFDNYTVSVITQVEVPVVTPVGGTYDDVQNVALSATPGDATIRYTLDGSTPTSTTGTIYSGLIAVGPTATTLKAIAYKVGLTDSAVSTHTYNFQALGPVFTPAPGTYANTQNVTITTSTSDATIHYTTDGTTPTSASPTYSSPIEIAATTTLSAIVVKSGLADSGVTSGQYTIKTGTPFLTPVGGNYDDTQNVNITTATTGASIRYTTDGSPPTPTSGTIYTGPITVSSDTTIFAIAYKDGVEESELAFADYFIRAATPVFSPVEGSYSNAQNVTITTSTPGATIRYTTDGSEPSQEAGILYTGPVPVTQSTTLIAIAYKAGIPDSFQGFAIYNIKVGDPVFNPPPNIYPATQNVAITTATTGATIRYTTDGSDPTPTTGTVYTGPVAISATATLKAIAFSTGSQDSEVTSGNYTIDGSFALTLDDTFTDGGRDNGADALDSQWYVMSNVGPNTAGVVDGALKLERTQSTTAGFNPHAVTTFPSQTLTVGQTITLGFDYRSLGGASATGIRYGLYNSGGTNLVGDVANNPPNPGTIFQNDLGYSVFAPHRQTGNILLYYRPANGSNNTLQLAGGANSTVVRNVLQNTATDTATFYQASLAVTRLSATQFNVAVTYAGTTFNQDYTPAAVTETFNTLAIFAITGQNQAFTIDNVRVTLSPPPVVAPNTLVAWRTLQGLAEDGSQDLLNPSGDGISNLLKYALNLAPNAGDLVLSNNRPLSNPDGTTVPELTGLPVLRLNGTPASVFTYIRRKATTVPGVSYTVEWSDGLSGWAINPSATEIPFSLDTTWERVTVTDSFNTSQKPKRFARLSVTAP